VGRLFTTEDAYARGLTQSSLRWGETKGRWRRVHRGVYAEGPEEPTPLDRQRAAVIATHGAASGSLAGVLYGLDAVEFNGKCVTVPPTGNGRRTGVRRCQLDERRITVVGGIRCTDGVQTMLDLAPILDDLTWEQALESALRKRLLALADVAAPPPRTLGADRISRVLALRPVDAPPTESLLETLMVQLARLVPGLGPPVRQYEVYDEYGQFVARVDLAWPELGLFIELDGQHHLGQPAYDARRETAVVAATGWLCGRFTWVEVVRFPASTSRRLAALVEQCRRRPLV
jgi:hypothetical protein